MTVRTFPSDLADTLRRALEVESAAGNRQQTRHAIDATARLLRSAQMAGWTTRELAGVIGMTPGGVRARIAAAKHPDHLGVDITPAGPPDGHRPPPLPLEQREWLTRREARDVVGVTDGAITHWYQAGILPRTVKSADGRLRYCRRDLERVLSFRDHGNRNIQRRWVLAAISDAASAGET